MKKIYSTPNQKVVDLGIESAVLLANSDDIAAFQAVGDEYDSDDVSYTKERKNLWDEAW